MNMTNPANTMSHPSLEPIKISLKGIEGLGRKSLAFLLSTQKTRHYEIVEDHPDAIEIIDIDDYRGKAAWENRQNTSPQQSSSRVIVLGLQPASTKNGIVLQKPFRPRQLLEAINSLAEEAAKALEEELDTITTTMSDTPPPAAIRLDDSSAKESVQSGKDPKGLSSEAAASLNRRGSFAFLGTAEDVDLDDQQAMSRVQYNPHQFLNHQFQKLTQLAAKEKKYLQVSCCEATFYIDPFQKNILTQVEEKKQRSFGALPLDHSAVSYRKLGELPEDIETTAVSYSFNSFIWRMELASSRGRLPENTNIDRKYKLRRWPNLTRLVLFPHATQISATWMGSGKSIREITTMLNMPQRYVFAFFAAANAIGFLLPADSFGEATEKEQSAPDTPHKRRGLFRRLLKTLGRKQEGTEI
jgi:hypothetical protein